MKTGFCKTSIKSVFFLLVMSFAFSGNSAAAGVDLEKAKEYYNDGEFEKALKIAAPCLKMSLRQSRPWLEDCLYMGESFAWKYQETLWERGFKYSQRAKALRDFGLKPLDTHYNGPFYNHDFFRRLKVLFPQSKYKDLFNNTFLDGGDIGDWKAMERDSNRYLGDFPKGQYAVKVKLDLARAYDNLWDVLFNVNEYRRIFSGGDRDKDHKKARSYRAKAIRYYKQVVKDSKKASGTVRSWDIREAKDRLKILKEDKGFNIMFYMIN